MLSLSSPFYILQDEDKIANRAFYFSVDIYFFCEDAEEMCPIIFVIWNIFE